MKKIKLNFGEFDKNSESISDFLSKKAMGQITGGDGGTYSNDATYVAPYKKVDPIPYSKS